MSYTIHLNLKRKWFDMILSGEKKEEYRDLTDYWDSRLVYHFDQVIYEKHDTVTFSNGYAKDRDQMIVEVKGIRVGKGKKEWGADPDKDYFVIELGEIISKKVR